MNKAFKNDVFEGLSADKKRLSSKYFYDDKGSRIFQEIMSMPEYYLTNCEYEIFRNSADSIFKSLDFKTHFNLVELGAGDGVKTAEIIRYLSAEKIDFTYKPIDISQEANAILSAKIKEEFPLVKIETQTGDYFEILKNLRLNNDPSLLLFIGSNIGNYQLNEAKELFRLFNQSMNKGDKLLIGVDLKKEHDTVHKAYYDSKGITKRFNLNLLERINRELGGEFNLNDFDFKVNYDTESGEVRSYLTSKKEQDVRIKDLETTFHFKKKELIWTELSKKYDLKELENLISLEGFKLVKHFLDKKKYFTDSLFEKES